MRATVVAAAALSPAGHEWRGLAAARPDGTAVPPGAGSVPAKARRLMSRAAELSALALARLLGDAGWVDGREAIGFFLGVGPSGGDMAEVQAMLSASRDGDALSLARLGGPGLAACTPLLAFQLMNNFTLCHGAILHGVGGPSAAFFSRGAGTTMALCEALWALAEGDCDRAVAGGADSALHAVTRAELRREGHDGPAPSEGAGLLALAREGPGLARVEATVRPGPPPAADVVMRLEDVTARLGQALAASPALAWAMALDLVAAGAGRVAVVGRGLDGDIGTVVFER